MKKSLEYLRDYIGLDSYGFSFVENTVFFADEEDLRVAILEAIGNMLNDGMVEEVKMMAREIGDAEVVADKGRFYLNF